MCSSGRLKVTREFGYVLDAVVPSRSGFTKIGFSDATKVIERRPGSELVKGVDMSKRLTVAEFKAKKQEFMDMMEKAGGDLGTLAEMNATILASAKKSADPPIYKDGKHFDAINVFPGGLNYFDHPTSWPYTLHDTDESPFNLNHGYMWGRYAGFGG